MRHRTESIRCGGFFVTSPDGDGICSCGPNAWAVREAGPYAYNIHFWEIVGDGVLDVPPMPTASGKPCDNNPCKPEGPATKLPRHCEERSDVAIPWSTEQPGKSTGSPEGELPRRGKRGHPGVRACGPRNDVVIGGRSFCFSLVVSVGFLSALAENGKSCYNGPVLKIF